MTIAKRPAAYIGGPAGSDDGALAERQAMAQAARQRGWPAPAIYADDGPPQVGGSGPALGRLEAAVIAGRHDGLHAVRRNRQLCPALAKGGPDASARPAGSAAPREAGSVTLRAQRRGPAPAPSLGRSAAGRPYRRV
jgi:hypothetical protein